MQYQGYRALEKPGHKWHIHGWFCLAGCYLLMMYYTTVCGWMMIYFVKFLTGSFSTGMDSATVSDAFGQMLLNPGQMLLWMAVTVAARVPGLQLGIEKGPGAGIQVDDGRPPAADRRPGHT